MAALKTEEYILPTYWASALINNDYSGCNSEEIAEIENFIKSIETKNCIDADVENSYFAHSNDANRMGGDVCVFTFTK